MKRNNLNLIDVKEEKSLVEKSLERFHFSFPILLDEDGAVSTKYAPEGVQPALARYEVSLASNLIIDKEGKIKEAWPGGFRSKENRYDMYLKAKPFIDELLNE